MTRVLLYRKYRLDIVIRHEAKDAQASSAPWRLESVAIHCPRFFWIVRICPEFLVVQCCPYHMCLLKRVISVLVCWHWMLVIFCYCELFRRNIWILLEELQSRLWSFQGKSAGGLAQGLAGLPWNNAGRTFLVSDVGDAYCKHVHVRDTVCHDSATLERVAVSLLLCWLLPWAWDEIQLSFHWGEPARQGRQSKQSKADSESLLILPFLGLRTRLRQRGSLSEIEAQHCIDLVSAKVWEARRPNLGYFTNCGVILRYSRFSKAVPSLPFRLQATWERQRGRIPILGAFWFIFVLVHCFSGRVLPKKHRQRCFAVFSEMLWFLSLEKLLNCKTM